MGITVKNFPWQTVIKPGYDTANRNRIVNWLIMNIGLDRCWWTYIGVEMHVLFTLREDQVLFKLTWYD
jgi:hypothetical protein